MTRAVLAALALAGLLAMHGMSAHHEPMPTHVVHMAPQSTESMHDLDTTGELCLAILTSLVSLLLLVIGARTYIRQTHLELAVRLMPAASARASPRRPPSISKLCVLLT